MNLMASAFLMLLAIVGVIVFIADLTIVNSSLLVPLTTERTTTTEKIKTTTVKPFNCKKTMMVLGKRVFKQFGVCNRDMKVFIPSEKEREKRIQCSVKCVLKKMKVVNEKDLINEASVQAFFDTFLPPAIHEIAHYITAGCVEDFESKGEAPAHEDFCESYGVFLHCVQDSISGMCL